MNKRRLTIYFMGVLLGCILLALIPRKPHEPVKPHPWIAQTAPHGYYPRTLTDDIGRTVTLREQPRLIVSLAPSVTDMLVAMGMADHLVGVTRWCDAPEVAQVERIGGLDSPDIEKIAALQADLVIGTEMTPPGIYERIGSVHIPALAFKHQGFDDVLADMRTLALEMGVPRLGLEAVEQLEAQRAKILASVPQRETKPVAVVLYDLDTLGSAGRGTWVNDLLVSLHIHNLAAEAQSPWPALSKEALVSRDPDFIILPKPVDADDARRLAAQIAALKDDPVWGGIRAVREDHIIVLPPNLLSVPGPRSMQALEAIAEGVYGTSD